MNILKNTLLLGLLFFSMNVIAAPASESSIKQLFAVMHTKRIAHTIQDQYRSLMENIVQRKLRGETSTPKQKKIIENMMAEINDAILKEASWKKMEPIYLRGYKKTFSEKEVQGMLEFFKSPAGQAYVNNLPILTHDFMLDYEKNVAPGLMQRIQTIENKYLKEFISTIKK